MDELRAECDGLIIGPRTLAIDNPNVIVKAKPEASPVPITICNNTVLLPDLRFFHGPRKALVFSVRPPQTLPCEWVQTSDTEVQTILQNLADRGFKRVLLEGGATLASAFFAADRIDRFFLTIVPWALGGSHSSLAAFTARRYALIECRQEDQEVFLEYKREYPV
jgi:2,5-diamino-6-(ribosylamino)-4(3H)-pyrimidinone 5'-phosphate reductase